MLKMAASSEPPLVGKDRTLSHLKLNQAVTRKREKWNIFFIIVEAVERFTFNQLSLSINITADSSTLSEPHLKMTNHPTLSQ